MDSVQQICQCGGNLHRMFCDEHILCMYLCMCVCITLYRKSVALYRPWLAVERFVPFRWQTLSFQCKHLDNAAPCILSCCSLYLEFTSLTVSTVTKELRAFAL